MNELDLFAAAIAIADPSGRAALLDRESLAGRPEIRQRLNRLLEAHIQSHPMFDRPNGRNPELTGAHEPSSPLLGTIIAGRYKLLEEIGDGGMGTVWMAEQREPVKRLVAVKLIKAGMDSKAVLARFEAERQALAMMDHPNIAKVHDAGTDDQGRPYFVMELVKGLPLTEYCDARKLSVNDRLDLFVQICSAVQHAHQKAVIHRDLKPTNVLVTEHDGKPVPKVIDFGLAKALGATNVLTDRTLHTAYGTVVGTPLYMAPEQVGINALDVDTRTDIYALGVILYELLTGSTPLEKARFKETAWEEMKRLIREEEPPKPSTRLSSSASLPSLAASRQVDPMQLRRLVRGELDWIVMKALDKDRSRRYETANGLSKDVQRYLKGDSVEACPPTLGYRLRKAYRRNRGAALTAGAISAIMLLATGVSLAFGIQAKRAEHQAARSAEDAKVNEEIAQRERDEAKQARHALETEQNSRAKSDYSWLIQSALSARQQHQFETTKGFLGRTRADLRGWEWHYLNRLCRSDDLYSLPTAHKLVASAKFSPDGQWIVTNSYINDANQNYWLHTVQIWDAATRQPFTLCENVPHCGTAEFSPDSQQILIAERNKVTVWDLATRTAQAPIVVDPNQRMFSATFSPDGKKIAVGNWANFTENDEKVVKLALWDAKTRECIWSKVKPRTGCGGLSFSADGQWILGAEFTREPLKRVLKVWDAATGKELLEVAGKPAEFMSGVFSPDSSRLATAGSDNTPKVWRIRREGNRPVLDGEPLLLRGHTAHVFRPAFSSDGTRIVTVGDDGTARIWNAATGTELRVLAGHTKTTRSAVFSPDGRYVLTAGEDGTARVWEVEVADPQVVISNAELIFGAAPSPNGDRLLTFNNFETKIRDARTWKPLPHTLAGGFACWSPDGRRIVTWYFPNTANGATKIRVYDAGTGQRLREIVGKENTGLTYNLKFNADGSRILVHEFDRSVTVWDVNTDQKWVLAEPGKSGLREAGYSPDGKTIFIERGEQDKFLTGISILDAETHKPIVELETGTFEYRWWRGTFSRDGRLFLGRFSFSDSSLNECRIWDTTTGKLLRPPFRTQAEGGASLEFSPDGSRILSAGMFGKLVLLDAQTGEELLVSPFNNLRTATFDRDGHKIIVATTNEVRILDGTPLPEPKK